MGLPYRDLIVLDLKKKLTQQSDKVKMLTEDNQTLQKEASGLKESNACMCKELERYKELLRKKENEIAAYFNTKE